jgi:hypothetical protein
VFLQSLIEFARLAALVTTCCRQEKEHTKEVESMQLEINDLHAQLTTLRNALAATQVKRLCVARACNNDLHLPRFAGTV